MSDLASQLAARKALRDQNLPPWLKPEHAETTVVNVPEKNLDLPISHIHVHATRVERGTGVDTVQAAHFRLFLQIKDANKSVMLNSFGATSQGMTRLDIVWCEFPWSNSQFPRKTAAASLQRVYCSGGHYVPT